MSSVQQWYDEKSKEFAEAAAIELQFVGLDVDQQARLNDFKLWAIENGEVVAMARKSVLEFGAGHGRLAIEMPQIAQYVGVDFSHELIEIGRERLAKAGLSNRAELIEVEWSMYDGPSAAFDVVCSLGGFPYVADPVAALAKMKYHLRPGGVIFFDWYNRSPVYLPIRALKYRFLPPTGGKARADTARELRRSLEQAGLVDVRIVMREYPLLADWYAIRRWEFPLHLRNWLARHPIFDPFALTGFAFARKPV